MTDPFDLERFVEAQEPIFESALAELVAGRKQGHWMWFIFPQMAGLGRSHDASYYGIGSLEEARAYLLRPLLGRRLRQCASAVLEHDEPADALLGSLDAIKFRSSMTLFELAGSLGDPFGPCLDKFFAGERDPATLSLLGAGT